MSDPDELGLSIPLHEQDRFTAGSDECWVGDWLHLEQMDDRKWWTGVGKGHIWMLPSPKGKSVKVVILSQQGVEMWSGTL